MLSYQADIVLRNLSDQPKKSRDIQRNTGYTDTEIRACVRELRLAGVKVCSGSQGFWLWNGTDDTWLHTKNAIKSRAKQLLELYNAMENMPAEGQLGFFE